MSSRRPKGEAGREPQLQPQELAAGVLTSIQTDLQPMVLRPKDRRALETLARWGKAYGLDHDLGVPPGKVIDSKKRADLIADRISPDPARFQALAERLKEFETDLLRKEVKQLESCGTTWGRIIRIYWRGRSGRIVIRERGRHACKHRWCPRCGRSRQARLVDQMERILVLMEEWGLNEANLRFITLTIPNGDDIPTLRKQAHKAWARLQRTRTWPREVFGWFRGTEIVTGQDGRWNLHLHVVVAYWATQVSYQAVWNHWAKAVGDRCQVDVKTLSEYRRTARGRGTARAARYIVKYLTKRENLDGLSKGPGGLAHLLGSTRHFRAFGMGGGCSLLRRLLPILMPSWALRAERILAGAELREGLPPIRAEEVDPDTGEAMEIPPPDPCPDPQERAAWRALALRLADDEGTVGVRCGPRGRFRRLGAIPLPSRGPTLKAWERTHRISSDPPGTSGPLGQGRLTGVRGVIERLVGWEVFTCESTAKVYETDAEGVRRATGKTRSRVFRALLPKGRFAWKQVGVAVWRALLGDESQWGKLRRMAFKAWAAARVSPWIQEDHVRALLAALDDRVIRANGAIRLHTTKRTLHGAELLAAFVQAAQRDPQTVWDQAIQRLRHHAEALSGGGLLELRREEPGMRQLRADLGAEWGF